jgi:hypothetical protein
MTRRHRCPSCREAPERCEDCRGRLAGKQARRRARRIAEGVDPAQVWGHAQKPSGTGWDVLNARRVAR